MKSLLFSILTPRYQKEMEKMKETMRHKQGTILNVTVILHQTMAIKIKLQSSCPE